MKNHIAYTLDNAFLEAKPVSQMAEDNNISLAEAYKIQQELIQLRVQRGKKVIGYKLGFTSKAKMQQMGVNDLIWGILTNDMEITQDNPISLSKYIHPRAEPEIAFKIDKDITKPISLEELPEYVSLCASAIEVIDSRYENFKFSLEDVVADNCSSSGFIIGEWKPIPSNLSHLSIQLFFNDKMKQEGNSFNILENPLQPLVELSRLTTEIGITISKRSIVLAGAATAAEFLEPNTMVKANIEELGSIEFSVQ